MYTVRLHVLSLSVCLSLIAGIFSGEKDFYVDCAKWFLRENTRKDGTIIGSLLHPGTGPDALSVLRGLCRMEQLSFKAMQYVLTNPAVVKELCAMGKNGISVSIIVDKQAVEFGEEHIRKLMLGGIEILVYSGPGYAKMHDKTCIFGNRLLWTGSANLTIPGVGFRNSLKRSIESILVMNDCSLIDKFTEKFLGLKTDPHVTPVETYLRLAGAIARKIK